MKITTLLAIACVTTAQAGPAMKYTADGWTVDKTTRAEKEVRKEVRNLRAENEELESQVQEYQRRAFQSEAEPSHRRARRPNSYVPLAADPWGPNGQFANQPKLSEEQILNTQGNNAQAQWAQASKK